MTCSIPIVDNAPVVADHAPPGVWRFVRVAGRGEPAFIVPLRCTRGEDRAITNSSAYSRPVDNCTVTAAFGASQSFVMAWLLSESQAYQNGMLNHEQRHYHITALVFRDLFVDVMLLKSRTFDSE